MESLFITSSGISSERWQAAFDGATVISGETLCEAQLSAGSIVWLLLEGDWKEYLERALAADAKVVAMTLNESTQQAHEVIAAGGSGYIHAFAATEMLLQVHKVVASGGAWLGAALLQQLILSLSDPAVKNNRRMNVLTERERSVAVCVSVGKSNKEVASELEITERTVKAHLSACFSKLNVRDRVQLALVMSK